MIRERRSRIACPGLAIPVARIDRHGRDLPLALIVLNMHSYVDATIIVSHRGSGRSLSKDVRLQFPRHPEVLVHVVGETTLE